MAPVPDASALSFRFGPPPTGNVFEPAIRGRLSKIEKVGWRRMKWIDGFSLLHFASRKGRLDLVRYLLEASPFWDDIDVEAVDKQGRTAASYAKTNAIRDYLAEYKSSLVQICEELDSDEEEQKLREMNGSGYPYVSPEVQTDYLNTDTNTAALECVYALLRAFVDAVRNADTAVPHAA